jgi:hypothetical protein
LDIAIGTQGRRNPLRRSLGLMAVLARNELNRIAKAAVDRSEVESYEAALALFHSYRFGVAVGEEVAADEQLQAALLTVMNAGPRACLGGVDIAGALDAVLTVPWADGATVADAARTLGCSVVRDLSSETPLLVIGTAREVPAAKVVVYLRVQGWCGGVTIDPSLTLEPEAAFGPAGSLAGAIAVSEIFQHVRGSGIAGRRTVGLSLWRPELDWTADDAKGVELDYLPSSLWLLGLGHLGQANAWTIGLLPFADRSVIEVMLQDRDAIVAANEVTSMLLDDRKPGQWKTRLVSRRLEACGFKTRVIERLFDQHQRVQAAEPTVALAGFDNPQARRHLSDAGFSLVVDAGLGGGHDSYLDIMLHSFPGSRRSTDVDLWKAARPSAQPLVDNAPAYQRMLQEGGDRCGVLDLAGASVGSAFVGCAAAALAVAEVCRAVVAGPRYEVLDLSLRNPARVRVVEDPAPAPYAGGYVEA